MQGRGEGFSRGQHTFSCLPCAFLQSPTWLQALRPRPEGCTRTWELLAPSSFAAEFVGEKERENVSEDPVFCCYSFLTRFRWESFQWGCWFLCYLFLSHLMPAAGFFLLSGYLFFYLRLLNCSPFLQSVVLACHEIKSNWTERLYLEFEEELSSFNKNRHKHPQTTCTDNLSFLICAKILMIYFQDRVSTHLQLLYMKCFSAL